MATDAPTLMPTESQILTLTQWFSPAFPVGAFAYSHGLEWDITQGRVATPKQLEGWISTVLQHGSGRSDALFLAAAYRATEGEALEDVDAWCRAFAPSAERLKESTLQGAAFAATISDVWGEEIKDLSYPVAAGRAAFLAGLPLVLTAQMFLFGFMSNLVSVGVRLIPLGQTDGQRLMNALMPLCISIANEAQSGDLDQLTSTAFLADIASMNHETQYSRVFRT